LSIPIGLVKETEHRMGTNSYTIGLKMICASLGVNFLNEVGVWMGDLGTLKREGDGWTMKPKPIPKANLSAWINGKKEKMPVWRLSQAVVLLEYVYIVMKAEATAARLPEDDMIWLHLQISAKWFALFNKKVELIPWLDLLRHALYERLKMDSGRSPTAKQLFQYYASWLDECRALEKGQGDAVPTPTE
jgi:hypothetical protein